MTIASTNVRDLVARGREHAAAGRLEEALTDFENASNAGSIDGGYHAAVLLIGLGRLPEARQFLQWVLERDPRHANAIYQLGLIAESGGDPGRAYQFYAQALAAQPDHASARQRIAGLQASQFQQQAVRRGPQAIGRSRRTGALALLVPLIGLAAIVGIFVLLVLPSIHDQQARSEAIAKQSYRSCLQHFSAAQCEAFKP